MLKIVCTTCGKLLGDIQMEYEEDVAKINENNSLTDEEKIKQKQALLNKYHLTRYCCRMNVLGYINTAQILI